MLRPSSKASSEEAKRFKLTRERGPVAMIENLHRPSVTILVLPCCSVVPPWIWMQKAAGSNPATGGYVKSTCRTCSTVATPYHRDKSKALFSVTILYLRNSAFLLSRECFHWKVLNDNKTYSEPSLSVSTCMSVCPNICF